MNFREFLNESIKNNTCIISDGGMGTMIQKLAEGIKYKIPEDLNFYKSEVIGQIYREYLTAGSNIISTNTFGALSAKLADENAPHTAAEYIEKSISLAKEAVKEIEAEGNTKPHFVAWDTSTNGKLMQPIGPLSFDEAYESYKDAAIAAEKAGADLALIETMSDLYEVKAAVLAIRENTNFPVLTLMTFQPSLRTLTGADVLTCVTYLESLHPEAIGFNCGGSLEEDQKLAEEFLKHAHIPVMVQPNAGLPVIVNGKDVFKVEPEEFGKFQSETRKKGALILGGCCGTTPQHIAEMARQIEKISDPSFDELMESMSSKDENHSSEEKTKSYICSYNKTVQVGKNAGPKIIGERINPTGKKKCKEALMNKDMQFILDEAESQINAGAHILDVNVGLPGIDEKEMMLSAVRTLQEAFNVPLQIDSSEYAVLEHALRYYNGKALVNSVNGKQEVMDHVFPLIKKYGGAVVALCLDEDGIPPTAEGRAWIAKKIILEAAKYGIPVRDIFIDTLTLTVSSEQKTAMQTIKAIKMIRDEFDDEGIQFVLGVSNISFGLPRRDIINSRFFLLALHAGLSAAIINPSSKTMMDSYRAFRALECFDENCLDFIETYTGTKDPYLENKIPEGATVIPAAANTEKSEAKGDCPRQSSEFSTLISIIEKGFKDKSAAETEQLLKNHQPVEIINNAIVPALDNVGKDFESGRKFLPQLLLSAETVSNSFAKIKETLAATGVKEESKGTVVIATVFGDIHDIGKNIVRAMLENYGYNVIDLGKNVPAETIINTIIENKVKLVGLSALMTTTVINMEDTIVKLRAALKERNMECKICVGGAVLTADYAKKIGADFYSKDAMQTVSCAKEVFGR